MHPSEVRENYTQTMAKLRKNLSDKCGAYGIDWVDVDVAQGVLPVLSAYLTKRAKLFESKSRQPLRGNERRSIFCPHPNEGGNRKGLGLEEEVW